MFACREQAFFFEDSSFALPCATWIDAFILITGEKWGAGQGFPSSTVALLSGSGWTQVE
jgi:hypothetical protein